MKFTFIYIYFRNNTLLIISARLSFTNKFQRTSSFVELTVAFASITILHMIGRNVFARIAHLGTSKHIAIVPAPIATTMAVIMVANVMILLDFLVLVVFITFVQCSRLLYYRVHIPSPGTCLLFREHSNHNVRWSLPFNVPESRC